MCPSADAVAAFVERRLPAEERDAIEAHLDACSACLELVTLLGRSREPSGAAATTTTGGTIASAATWEPGEALGRYVLLARLGAGGLGVVYAAYDPVLDRKVAIKILREAGPAARSRLTAEARAVARLAHPNVVAIHDVGEAEGEVFAAMEFVDGVTVAAWLREPRTPAAIVEVFAQAARGLAAAHAAGLVHRDVKPANLMVGADGRTRILDFGLATRDPAAERAGTPAYMAPEQAAGRPVDARADQYALCVCLWEALAGRAAGSDDGAIAGVPDRVNRAVARGRAADPAARFASLDALVAELAPPPRRRRARMLAAIGAGVAAGAIAMAVARRPTGPAACAVVDEPLRAVWDDGRKAELGAAFAATGAPYATAAAAIATAQLERWAAAWRRAADDNCRATRVAGRQSAAAHAARQACLDDLAGRFGAVVELARHADAALVARADGLADAVADPTRCDDAAALLARPAAPPAERDRAELTALAVALTEIDAARLAGRGKDVAPTAAALATRADALGDAATRARAALVGARLVADGTDAVPRLHAAATLAYAAGDRSLLAEIWIELVGYLGNDQRWLEQAATFDRYAAAAVAEAPDGARLALPLAMARCNRNLDSARAGDADELAARCQDVIARARAETPPREDMASAAQIRLGHFQRLAGHTDDALATLSAAVAASTQARGAEHPNTGLARYALGLALSERGQHDAAIAELRAALAIRRAAAASPDGAVAESLQGLGDALSTAGRDAEAVPLFEEALAIHARVGGADGAHAASVHVLAGISYEALGELDRAVDHYLRAADIADRALVHREDLAAMALRLAAAIELGRDRAALGVAHLERALALLARGRAAPLAVGMTQQNLAVLLFALGPRERGRARAMVDAARASYRLAGTAGAAYLAELDADPDLR